MSRDSIRQRVVAATPGPWDGVSLDGVRQASEDVWDHATDGDEEFVIHARQDIPALLAVADAAHAFQDCGIDVLVDHSQRDEFDRLAQALAAALAALEALP